MSGIARNSILSLFQRNHHTPATNSTTLDVEQKCATERKRRIDEGEHTAAEAQREIKRSRVDMAHDEYQRNRAQLRAKCATLVPFPATPCVYADVLSAFNVDINKEQTDETARRRIRSRADVMMNTEVVTVSLGDERLKKLRYYLNNCGFERSEDQKDFHHHFTIAVLPLIYGEEWDRVSVRVMAEFGITELKTEVLCMTPRRFGKSFAVAMFMASVALAVPGSEQAVFSPGKRASNSLMKLVLKFMKHIPGAERRIAGGNDERLYIAARELADGVGVMSLHAKGLHTAADTSKISCFPSSPKGQFSIFISQRTLHIV